METQRWSLSGAHMSPADHEKLHDFNRVAEKMPPIRSYAAGMRQMGKKEFLEWVSLRRQAIRDIRQQAKSVQR